MKAALEAKGVKVIFVAADLADMDDTRKVVAEADKAFGRIDILVNSAGITDRGTIWDTDPELFDQMFAVNVRAPFFLMQDALKVMKREKIEGSIVNIISMSGHGGQSFITAYCSSKGALITLTKNVAYSVLNHRIRVNGLTIGHMDTPGEDRIMKTYHGAEEGWIEDAKKQKPFGRLLDTAEVSRAVAYLSSAESGMMTGSIIDFDQQVARHRRFAADPAGCLRRPPSARLRRPATATASVMATAMVVASERKPSKFASATSIITSAGAAIGDITESVMVTIFAPRVLAAPVSATVSLA